MAVKSKLNEDVLAKLGVKKLSQIALDEAQHNPGFRRRIAAAVASSKGPDGVAKIIDRRLAGLMRARGFIDWEGNKAFADDLRATVATITEELGRIDPDAAIDRIVRFLGTAQSVFNRVDDSNGRVQEVFHLAADAIPGIADTLPVKKKVSLLERLHHCLVDDEYGFSADILTHLLPLLSSSSITAWNLRLAEEGQSTILAQVKDGDSQGRTKFDRLIRLRQAIADHRGDCDAFIALEKGRGTPHLDTFGIAERLLKTSRYAEALEWVRKPGRHRLRRSSWVDITESADPTGIATPDQVCLELSILEAKGDTDEAQTLRWNVFLKSLDTSLLREYVNRLAEFEEFEVLDHAFAHAAAFKDKYRALCLFVSWPRFDLASHLVLGNREPWDGRLYEVLRPAAEALEEKHPGAASVLYRALLGDILDRTRSTAYGHAARYLDKLDALGGRISPDDNLTGHTDFVAEIQRKHGRKSAFWARVDQSLR
jgi:hypothetical protein